MAIFDLFKKNRKEHKKKRIIFHIGRPKTGSKAIQFFLYENREKFKELGLLYPESVLHEKFHHPLVWSIKKVNQDRYAESPSVYFQRLFAEFEKSNCQTCILSSEDASIGSDLDYCKTLKAFLKDYEVFIVVYLRRQDSVAESSYNQSVKNSSIPYSGTVSEYLKLDLDLNYKKFLEPWSEVFGKEHIAVRVFGDISVENGVVGDFCDYLGVNLDLFNYEKQKVNPALDRDTLEIVRMINTQELHNHSRVRLMRKIRQIVVRYKKEELSHFSVFDPGDREKILKEYEESNKYIANNFLGRDDLFVIKQDQQEPNSEYPGLSNDVLIKIIIELWNEIYRVQKH